MDRSRVPTMKSTWVMERLRPAAFCSSGDKILLHAPTYIGFTGSLTNAGYKLILSDLILDETGTETVASDKNVEVVTRGGAEQKIRIFINHNAHTASACGVSLPPFGCKIETL